MSIINVLKEDHAAVKELFAQYHSTGDVSILATIKEELTLHAHAEEAVVYPVLSEMDPPAIQHSKEEHDEIETLLAELPDNVEAVAALEEAVEHHVQEEETKIFPEAEQKIPADTLDGLVEPFEHFKQSATEVRDQT